MNFFNLILRPSLTLLGAKYRRKGLFLIPLLLLQSLLDVLSVASFAPMALLIVRPESIRENALLLNIFDGLSFRNVQFFALAWVGAVALFFLIKHGINAVITRLRARYAFDVAASLSQKAIDHFINLDYRDYHDLQSSVEQLKITHLPISFANNILLALTTLLTEGLILIMMLITLMIYDWRSVFFLMTIILPAIFFYNIIKKRLSAINHSLKTNYPGLIHQVLRLFGNFIEVNLYQKREYFIKKIQRLINDLHQSQVLQTTLQANSFRLFETTAALGLCLLILYAVVAQIPPDATVMLLGLYTASGFRAVPSFNRIFIAFLQIKSNEYVLAGLMNMNTQDEESGYSLPVGFNKTLELKNISFGYPQKPQIFQNVNVAIAKGQRIALTGPSGCGKTTLLLIIMRFLQETQGEILVDNNPLEHRLTNGWRRHLAYVPQQPVIMDGSLIENIAFGIDPDKANRERINELLHLLDLGPWLSLLPDGLMTRFGEQGIKLSGGQRQRIAIARAFYSDADVLLLDEATSQVDAVTEAEVLEALKVISNQGKTLIMVTHRKSSLQFFDKVFQLQKGRIQEVIRENSPA